MNPKRQLIERAEPCATNSLAYAQKLLIDKCMWNRYDALLYIRQSKATARERHGKFHDFCKRIIAKLDEIEAGVEAIHLIVDIMDKSKATKPERENKNGS